MSPRPTPPTPDSSVLAPADTGLTLLELVVAMALFALVAVMALQSLQGTLRLRDLLAARSDASGEFVQAMELLRADLGAAAPLLFQMADGSLAPALEFRADGFALSLGGQADLPGTRGDGFQRVIWRLSAARHELTRQIWPTLIPASGARPGPEVVMAQGVTDIALRQYRTDSGWIDGADPKFVGASSALPDAVEITVTSDLLGPVAVMKVLR